ncbi:hypothetical protein [Dysgonomonas sp. 511]|uniref:hypothetical protein n=1 Tax=Dysgonomonas sp. 511 TaxID=2302930 RepID=UPI0013D52E64|nr:hypothetical protein [Dysgonomonas sp. 511]NDV79396.1 hypothetical protein [Dysgonomonas sp. 511]
MKLIIKKIALIAFCAFVAAPAVFAQQARVALKGNAYVIKEGKYAGLEIDGEVLIPVVTKYWVNFDTSTGKYFVAETENGDFCVLDRNGKQVKLGGRRNFYKASTVDGTIMTQATKDSPPKYFSENNLSVEVKVETASHDFFDKDRVFNPEKMAQAKASEQAEYLSSLVTPDGRFEIKPKPNSYRQQIFVQGKMLHEAQEYRVLSDPEYWNKTGCWAIMCKNNGYYGALLLGVYEKDGKQMVEILQTIPYEYTFVSHHDGNMIKATTKSITNHYFNFGGWKFDRDWKTGNFTPEYKKWVKNKSTGKWTLQKQEEK